jgi:hypothetical protein
MVAQNNPIDLRELRRWSENEGKLAEFKKIAKRLQPAAGKTEDYLNRRASRASRKKFEKALSPVPDVEPMERDTFGR